MAKTIHRPEYQVLLELLKELRTAAGRTQAECATALGAQSQSFMSDVERGSRRLDIVQLRDLCAFLGAGLPAFVTSFERELSRRRIATPSPAGKARKR